MTQATLEKEQTTSYKNMLVHQIADRFRSAVENEVVTHEELTALTGRSTRLSEGQSLVQKAKNDVLKHDRIVMLSVHGVGWKKGTSAEIVTVGPATIRTTRRVSNRGIAKLMCADFTGLSEEEKRKHSTSMSVLGTITLMASPQSVDRVEKRIIANNTTDPISEARVLRLMSE